MINFRLFGIPVLVEPWFWLTTFLLGGGTYKIGDRQGMIEVGLWMLVCFVSILVHEYGHALSGRRLAGGSQHIKLWAFGGLAYNQGGRFTPKTRLLMILAGPGAGLSLFALTVAAILLMFPGTPGFDILDYYLRGNHARPVTPAAFEFLTSGSPTVTIFKDLIWVNFWWSLVNLLPVFPLDGGQALGEIINSRKKMHQVGLVTGIAFAILGYTLLGSLYIAIMFGFLAYNNYRGMQGAGY